ncbi:mitochondrial ribosomal protein L48 [Osmia lignaria lignaria]|uniref:mitochondrial ribosomal protein L48 n=1 Tax=Osmia lignaria lignaria TaxID=1437193 RepID=UPI00402B4B4C
MVLNVFRRAVTCYRYPLLNKAVRFYGIYEPPYLKKEYEIPIYPTLNIQLRGYTYPLIEKYQSFVQKLADALDITVENTFPYPHREFKIKRFKKGGTVVDSEYTVKIYERDIQVSDITATKCPIFIRLLEATLPEGVSMCIDKYDPLLDKKRFIPDKELLELKSELNEILVNRGK